VGASLKSVHDQLETLASIGSTLQKGVKLKEYLKDPLFLKVIQYALDTSKTFKVKQFPEYNPQKPFKACESTQEIFEYLDKLDNQSGVRSSEKQALYAIASVDPETYEVIRRICIKDLRCGCSRKAINSARPNTIFWVPYQRCHTDKKIDNINFSNGAYIQEKADGMFATMDIIKGNEVIFYTRDGKQVKQLNKLKQLVLDCVSANPYWENTAWTGEFRVLEEDGTLMSRQKGNGIMNSCMYGTADQTLADRVVFSMWDGMPRADLWGGHCRMTYSKRLEEVHEFMQDLSDVRFNVIESHLVHSLEEAQKFYTKMRKEGKEGAILKNRRGQWKDHTSPDQIKMKNVSDASLRIIGWNEGNGKYSGMVGSLVCRTECGLCEVNVSGMSDFERAWDMDEMIGKIIDVEYESVIKSKSKELHSLYLPRYIEVREDRSEADTLKDLLNR